MGKKKTLDNKEQMMILRVLDFFEEEKRRGLFVIPVNKALKRTCAATGVSLSTVMRIKRLRKKILQERASLAAATSNSGQEPPCLQTLSTEQGSSSAMVTNPVVEIPPKKRRPSNNKLKIDNFMICSIRDIINNFYTVRGEEPSLKKILAVAKEELNFPGGKETLRKIVTGTLKYSFNKRVKKIKGPTVPKKREALVEKPEVPAYNTHSTHTTHTTHSTLKPPNFVGMHPTEVKPHENVPQPYSMLWPPHAPL